MRSVRLVGLDFGTTTSSCVVASANLAHNAVSGRQELTAIREDYRSDLVFTPYDEKGLDESRLQAYVDAWLEAGKVGSGDIFGGGALLTGLAARQQNSIRFVELVRSRLGEALIVTAGDPSLEAWLAFQASAAALSRSHPTRWVVNIDIGGGTTNIALGKNGDVVRTGSLFVGARHVQFVPGTYRVVKLSDFARSLFDHLGITREPGDLLNGEEVEAILDFYIDLIEGAVAGDPRTFEDPVAERHRQVALERPPEMVDPIVALSGGVSELVYGCREGKPLPPTTFFGDLGIDFARRLLNRPRWADHFRAFKPAGLGRATVYGLLRHATHVSGSTLFLSDPSILPLTGLPLVGRVTGESTAAQIGDLLQIIRGNPSGGCVRVVMADRGASAVAALGERIATALVTIAFPSDHLLVLIVEENVGKALGQYVARWGSLPLRLTVLDEIAVPDAHFVRIGVLHDQSVPVSFYGLN